MACRRVTNNGVTHVYVRVTKQLTKEPRTVKRRMVPNRERDRGTGRTEGMEEDGDKLIGQSRIDKAGDEAAP